MYRKIELDAPNVGALEKEYLGHAIDQGYVSTIGPFVSEFEERFSKYLGVKKAVSTQSGTAAMHIALHELGIGRGDEVIVPALTFVATVNPIVYVGARPIFVDVDSTTWNILPEKVEESITKKTKAIIPVHLYGNPAHMGKLMRIARKHHIHIIEDVTESLGATYNAKHTGTFGDFGCFSFNGNKVITTGGGGMVAGNNAHRLNHIKFLVNQGRDKARGFYHPEVGFNYRMTNIEAAMGLAQMKRLDVFLAKKKAFNRIYKDSLKGIGTVRFQEEYPDAQSSWWMTAAVFEEGIDISRLQRKLKEKGIPVRKIFEPVTEFPPYKKCKRDTYSNSYHIYKRGLCFPSSTLNREADIRRVCEVLKSLMKGVRI